MKRFSWYLIGMAGALLMAVACVRELPEPEGAGDPFPEGGKVTVTFSVPDFEGEVGTKAIDDKGSLQTLHLAVFGSNGYLKEYVKAIQLEETTQYYYYKDPYYRADMSDEEKALHTHQVPLIQFSATLTLTEKDRSIHFIGNGPETLPFDADTTVMNTLMSEGGNGGFWQLKRLSRIGAKKDKDGHYIDKDGQIIVDGKGYIPDDYTNEQLNDIPLVRNWARISLAAEASEQSNFTLLKFALVNVPSKGTIAPIMKGNEGTMKFVEGYETLTFQELQDDWKYPASLPDDAIFDDSIPEPDEFITYSSDTKAAYLYERPVPNERLKATYVIVYGTYQEDGQNYYYKVDLAQDGYYYPIYRNFDYQINITSVKSKGFTTPRGAAEAVGGVDISADVTTHHLGDISDGVAQLSVRPWTAHSFYMQQTDNDILSVKFFNDITVATPVVNSHYQDSINVETGQKETKKVGNELVFLVSNIPDPVNNPVTWELLPPEDNLGDVITDVFIGRPASDGWRQIYFSTIAPENGTQARTQTLRVMASYSFNQTPRELYREIRITVLPQQKMKLRCEKPELEDKTGAEQTLTILIPEGLPSSMFPLDFTIEPEEMTLMPKTGTNMPVVYGTSIAVPSTNKSTGTFQFMRSVTYAEYTDPAIISEKDPGDGSMWRPFTSEFVSTRTENATRIWVANDYFETNSTAFENAAKRFRNVTVPSFELADFSSDEFTFPVHFEVEESYKYGFPEITLVARGVTVVGGLPDDCERSAAGDGSAVYVYQATQSTQNLRLKPSVEITETEGHFSLIVSAPDDHYTSTTIALRRFSECRFLDGIYSLSQRKYSQVMFEHLNVAGGVMAPFSYRDESEFPAVVTLREVGNNTPFTYLSYPGQPKTGTPTVDNFPLLDASYHEIPFSTKNNNTAPLSFRLMAPSYLTKTITAGRFSGQIGNNNSTAITNSTFDNKAEATISFNNGCKVYVEFNKAVTLENGNLKLEKTSEAATETFTMRVISKTGTSATITAGKPLYYVEVTFADGSTVPAMSLNEGDGKITRYPGVEALQYNWNFPVSYSDKTNDPDAHTLTFTSPTDVVISKIVIRGIGSNGATFTHYPQP